MSAKLEVEGISKHFRGVKALQDVTLSIESSQLLGLIGPNGSGKSTLVNCVTGYFKPDTGRVIAMGSKISGLPSHKIFRLGIARTFQTPQLYPELNAKQHLRVATIWQHDTKDGREKEFDELLNFLKLEGREKIPASLLTHFEQRKLEIGTRLAISPKFLLLDEPAAGLSPEEIDELLNMIKSLREKGMGLLVIEHTMRVIVTLSDTVKVLSQGKIIASGSPQEITSSPAVVEAFLGRWKPKEKQ